MSKTPVTQAELDSLLADGMAVDAEALRKNMSSQFQNPYECYRELVVNASDAGASRVTVQIFDVDDDYYDVEIIDDGHGMDEQRIQGLFTLFRSTKQDQGDRATVGQHGVGFNSLPAAGQVSLEVRTSTGQEAWCGVAGSLLSSDPIRITALENVGPPGTRMKIRFKKPDQIGRILSRIQEVLTAACRYLPMTILLKGSHDQTSVRIGRTPWVDAVGAQKQYIFRAGGVRCDAVLELRDGPDEVRQGKVLISTKYDLLGADGVKGASVPGLGIRLDSPDFELPFGRHGLRNEEVLGPISRHLRTTILPKYVSELRENHLGWNPDALRADDEAVERVCLHLLTKGDSWVGRLGSMRLFSDVIGHRHSLRELEKAVATCDVLYVEGEESAGIDYAVFGAPVLSRLQSTQALAFLEKHFAHKLITLSSSDLAIEPPSGSSEPLSEKELRFQKFLRLHPGVATGSFLEEPESHAPGSRVPRSGDAELWRAVCQEAEEAVMDLDDVEWRTSRLVQRDGKTPSTSQRLLLRGTNVVVLNLNHPEVSQLVTMCEHDPLLAGHMGLAMALTDAQQKFLEHLSPAAREDLLLADAMARSQGPDAFEETDEAVSTPGTVEGFLRVLNGLHDGSREPVGSFPSWMLHHTKRGQA